MTILSSTFEKSVLKVDTVVLANVRVDDSIFDLYTSAGLTAIRIGDARKIRNLRGAVSDGANRA